MDVQDNPQVPAEGRPLLKTREEAAFIPALVSGLISVGLIRSGFAFFFFLVPLGFIAYGYNLKSAWLSVVAAVLGNSLFSVGLALISGTAMYPWVDVLYIAIIMVVFTWIGAPPFRKLGVLRLSIGYRFIIASVIGSLTVWFIIGAAQSSFDQFLRSQGEALSSLYRASAGTDVVQQSLMEAYVTPENIITIIRFVMIRGGGIASWVVIFLVNRQISLLLSRFIRRVPPGDSIIHFQVSPGLIWVLSCSLLGVLVGKVTALLPLEILAWNMLTICGILYLAQGGGILWHFLSRKDLSPFIRLSLHILLVVLIISPGINLGALGLLLFLGIAEHWVPFRAPKSDGPSSTPGM